MKGLPRGKVTMRARAMRVAHLRARRIEAVLGLEGNFPGMDEGLRRQMERDAQHIARLTTPVPTARERSRSISEFQRVLVENLISQSHVAATPAAILKHVNSLDIDHKPDRRKIRMILAELRRKASAH